MMGMKLSDRRKAQIVKAAQHAGVYLLLTCLAYVIVYPLFGRVMYSFMTEADLNDDTVHLFTKHFTLDNYRQAIDYMHYGTGLVKSLVSLAFYSLLQVGSATLIAYGLARFRFPGRNFLFVITILTLIIPPQILSTPLYFQFRFFNLFGLLGDGVSMLNTPLPLALLCMTGLGLKSGLLIFMLRQYFQGFPKELEEAASIDGASPIRTFWQVAVPSARTMLVTVFLFSLVWQWTDDFYLSVFEPTENYLQVIITKVYDMVKAATAGTGTIDVIGQSLVNNAALLLFIAPLLLIFLFGQRYFIESVERSGIVG